ncbi:sensor histidine kinase [Pelagibius marinus]|uniref:sensor histidine kinase n=1 Tax=Pelagibius marinus TaxID=2762760 RepID=UPI001872AE5A|nr:histidine kinase dimerization/phospho-acceptor domain-containing protein [Pelagibius marinus]
MGDTRRWSISRRLISGLTAALILLWLAAAGVAGSIVNHEVNEVFDSALQETAQRLAPLVVSGFPVPGGEDEDEDEDEDGGDPHEVRVIAENLEFAEHEEYLVYQVRDAEGHVLLRSHDAPEEPFPVALKRGHAEAGDWRFFTERVPPGRIFITVGEPLSHRREAVYETLGGVAAPLAVLIPLAGLVIFWTVRRSLAPVAEVRAALDARGGGDLSPIPYEAMPEELAPIIEDVNDLLARLERVLESERAFAANSAHELRTPVAAALAQTQRLAAELRGTPQQARIDQIAATLHRLGDLVEKLLQLARAESGIALRRDPVDVMPAFRLVVEEFARRGDNGGRLHFDDGGRARLVARTDIDAFAIALRNLIDNALHHGREGGPVVVHIEGDGSIHVVNGGPVVPPQRLATLTRRFERGAAEAPGGGRGPPGPPAAPSPPPPPLRAGRRRGPGRRPGPRHRRDDPRPVRRQAGTQLTGAGAQRRLRGDSAT